MNIVIKQFKKVLFRLYRSTDQLYIHYASPEKFKLDSLQVKNIRNTNKPGGGLWLYPSHASMYQTAILRNRRVSLDSLNTQFETVLRDDVKICCIDSIQKYEQVLFRYHRSAEVDGDSPMLLDFVSLSKDYDGLQIKLSACPFLALITEGWEDDGLVLFNLNSIV